MSPAARWSDGPSRDGPDAASPLRPQDLLALALGAGAIYLLTFSGSFRSNDELSYFAVASNLARLGRPTSWEMAWTTPFFWGSDAWGVDGDVYSKKGPLTSVLMAPLAALGLALPLASVATPAFLLNLAATAATVPLVALVCHYLGYRRRTALAVALAFAFATPAWAYSKTLFSEPLAGMLLTAAVCLLLRDREGRGLWLPPAAGLALGLAIMARLPTLIAVGPFAWYLLASSSRSPGVRGRQLLGLFVGLVAPLLALGAYNAVRFGAPWQTGLAPEERFVLEGAPLGAIGLLASPGRGLFFYAPVVVAALLGLRAFLRRHRAVALLALSIAGGHLLAYAAWWQWWGGAAWGPRFLLPVLPMALLPMAEVVEGAGVENGGAGGIGWARKVTVGALLAVSVLAQLPGAILSFNSVPEPEGPLSPLIWDPARSPLLQWPLDRAAWDLAWPDAPLGWTVLVGASVLALACAALLARLARGGPLAAVVVVGSAVLLLAWAMVAYPGGRADGAGLPRLLADLGREAAPNDLLVLAVPFRTEEVLRHNSLPLPTLGLSPTLPSQSPHGVTAIDRLMSRAGRVWLVLEHTPEGVPGNAAEEAVAVRGYRLGPARYYGGTLRLELYLPAGVGEEDLEAWPSGDSPSPIQLEAFRVRVDPGPSVGGAGVLSASGPVVLVDLLWRAKAAPGTDYKVFVHLVDDGGNMVGQVDRAPVNWSHPTSGWRAGDLVLDRHALAFPAGACRPRCRLLVGMYRWDGVRLPLGGPMERVQDRALYLADISGELHQ